ncbi:hypothetical protein K435DRAFT_854340 [Dendrothele bispora CBS 962.96]|uniref:Zn(2)-C6 fungal-type domain-containing protein n=1 Tax=Dendrothele bispora (strain CBS 962.96) TaxID=1314807 RepID=A0A4S8ME00_DENBC|nr:hypothetical protein K435DRAFT_854340 [Dendrothele bispora CBS 962.96]
MNTDRDDEDSRPSSSSRVRPIQQPEFTLLVAGHRGGKTSFLRLLLDTAFVSQSASKEQLASVAKFVQGCSSRTSHIRSTTVDVHLDGSNATIGLTLIDTPSLDLTDDHAAERSFTDILRHVESRLKDGGDAHDWRAPQSGDRFVHLCIYFLDPDRIVPPSIPAPPIPVVPRTRNNSFSQADQEPVILEPPVSNNPLHYRPTLPLDDINRIRRLSSRVNVLPVVSRADLLCNERMSAIKIAVRKDLADAGIGFGIFDEVQPADTANGYSHHHPNGSSSSATTPPPPSPTSPSLLRLPYALISPDVYSHSEGVPRMAPSRADLVHFYASPRRSLAETRIEPGKYVRIYRWGTVDVLDPKHCDFVHLREAIFHHMDTLQTYTRDYLFKKFQTDYHQQHSVPRHPLPQQHSLPSIAHLPHSSRPILAIDTAAPHNTITRHPVLNIPPESSVTGVHSAPPSRNISDSVSVKSSGSKTTKQRSKKITVASRKLKCDGGRPACSQCVKRSNSCDYMPQNKRRGTVSRRKEDESESESAEERSPDMNDHPPSPQMTSQASQPIPRRDIILDKPGPSDFPPSLPSISGLSNPPNRTRAVSHSGVTITRTFYPDNELPHIATLSLPDPSPSSTPIPMSAPSLPPIRPASEQQAAQRKRAATVPGKSMRTHSTSGPKVVACNFCRARKTKCDGAHPTCSSCARRSLACEYVNDRGRGGGGGAASGDGDSASGSGRKATGAGAGTGAGTRRPSAASKATPATPAPDYSNLPSPPSSRMLQTPADVYERRDILMVDAGSDTDLKRPSEHIDVQALRPTKKMRVSPMITDIP